MFTQNAVFGYLMIITEDHQIVIDVFSKDTDTPIYLNVCSKQTKPVRSDKFINLVS